MDSLGLMIAVFAILIALPPAIESIFNLIEKWKARKKPQEDEGEPPPQKAA